MKRTKPVNKAGRKSQLDSIDYTEVYRLALLGITDEQMCRFYDISRETFYKWKREDPKFADAVKAGKLRADAAVASAMYKRATGYEYEEDYITTHKGEPVIVPTTKHVPPDVGAIKQWLKSRHPELWADAQRVEVTGKGGGPIAHKHVHMDLSDLSDEELAVLEKVSKKVRTNGNGHHEPDNNGSHRGITQ